MGWADEFSTGAPAQDPAGWADEFVKPVPAAVPHTSYDPSAGGSTLQVGPWDTGVPIGQGTTRFLAGAGEGLTNLWRGVKERGAQALDAIDPQQQNLTGLVTGQQPQSRADAVKADIAESRRLDAPLNATGAGTAGNIGGTFAGAFPAALVPGAGTILGATAIGGLEGALQPSLSSGETAANVTFGAGGGAAGAIAGKLIKALARPGAKALPAAGDEVPQAVPGQGSLTEGQAQAARAGQNLGFQLTPGKASGSVVQQQIEAHLASNPATSGPFNAIAQNNQTTLNQVAARALGVNADELSAPVLARADKQIEAAFDQARAVPHVALDPEAATSGLANIETEHAGQYLGDRTVSDHPLFKRTLQFTVNGGMTGDQAVSLSSNLGKAARTQMTSQGGDRAMGMALYDTKNMVDDAIQGAAGPELGDSLSTARGQYRTLMNLTSRNTIVNPSSGNVNPRALATALMSKDRGGFTFGGNDSDLYNAARFSQAFPDIVGNSGTATRLGWNPRDLAYGLGAHLYMNPVVRGVGTAAAWPARKMAQALQFAGVPQALPRVGPVGAISAMPLQSGAQEP